ncbi:hypothetical protein [Cellvibrio mixtus]|uniref:hypothetical protein n=1 Tax=Cellvibrio mixtus TaxID=39650 RepID=UPI000587CB5B|nr:hypothetical protein [Cellvibrio mixtus]
MKLVNLLIVMFLSSSAVASNEDNIKQRILDVNAPFCVELKKELELVSYNYEKFAPNGNLEKKQFVGGSRLKNNPNDYYLRVNAYDISNDGVDDLIATDWIQKGQGNFYLAVYVYSNRGDLYANRIELKKFLMDKKISPRHKDGYFPLILEKFNITSNYGDEIEENFVGYNLIRPIVFKGDIHLLAEKNSEGNKKHLIFTIKGELKNLNLSCVI